jgi:hypothetical protein
MELCDGLLNGAVGICPVITDRDFGLQGTGITVSNLIIMSYKGKVSTCRDMMQMMEVYTEDDPLC